MTAAALFFLLVSVMLMLAPDLARPVLRFLGRLLALALFLLLCWLQGFVLVHEAYFRAAWLVSGLS